MYAAEPYLEGCVQGRAARELQQHGLAGTVRTQTRYVCSARKRGRVDARERLPWPLSLLDDRARS